MKFLIPLIALGCFIWLAISSQQSHGYKQSEIDALNSLVEQQIVLKHPKWTSKQAQIASVWNLTKDDVAKPVNIYAENGEVK